MRHTNPIHRILNRDRQLLRRDRFGEHSYEGCLAHLISVIKHLPTVSSDHDYDGWGLIDTLSMNDSRRAQAIHSRHTPIHQDHIIGLPLLTGLPDALHGQHPTRHIISVPTQADGGAHQYFAGRRIIVRNQDTHGSAAIDLSGGMRSVTRDVQLNVKPEMTAFSELTVYPQLAAHQLDHALTDHQAQSGSTEAARGRCLGLGETIKNPFQLLAADANAGIGNRDT